MAVHRVTRILPYAPEQLADLVADVRAYPDFVPWVTSMRVWNERAESEGVTVVDTMDGAADVVTAIAEQISGQTASKEA